MSVENLSVAASKASKGIVIIGAGLAGWHVIDAIRAKDKDIPITLITSDNGDRYHKPMLTMAISQQKSAADLVRASDKAAAEQLEHASTHWMRHTGITHDLEAGAEVRYVQAQARHSSPKTTARYDHKQEERWRNELEEAQTTR